MWMELESIKLSKIKSVKERQIPYDFTHMWNLRNKIDEHKGKKKRLTRKQTLNYRKQIVSCWRGAGWG